MSPEELKVVESLTRDGISKETIVEAIENPSIEVIDFLMEEFYAKTSWPYDEYDLIEVLFKRAVQQPVDKAFMFVRQLSNYDTITHCEPDFLKWLEDIDYTVTLPFLAQLIADKTYLAGTARCVIALHNIKVVYKDDLEAALNDESPVVATYAASRIASRLIAIGDRAAFMRLFALPYVGLQGIAWKVGREKIYEAVDALMEAAPREQDPETLRAMLWSLSVLRYQPAIGLVRTFVQHEHPLVALMARDALVRLTQG